MLSALSMSQHRSFLLECTPESFRAADFPISGIRMIEAAADEVERCRNLWIEVGRGFWTERHRWNDERWRAHLEKPEVTFWIAVHANRDLGCFELTTRPGGVKLEGFGLLPACRGRGFGRGLLTEATRRAFATGKERLWLHTATDDHPNALPNYLARGYRIVAERELRQAMRGARPPCGRAGRSN